MIEQKPFLITNFENYNKNLFKNIILLFLIFFKYIFKKTSALVLIIFSRLYNYFLNNP